jgi:Xaa-Pro aminopeptidase
MRITKNKIFRGLVVLVMVAGLAGQLLAQRTGYTKEEFAQRRAKLMEKVGDGVIILFGAVEASPAGHFKQDNDFYYYTGVEDAGAVLMMLPKHKRVTLFLPVQPKGEIEYVGANLLADPERKKELGIRSVRPLDQFEMSFVRFVGRNAEPVYLRLSAADVVDGSRRETTMGIVRRSQFHYNSMMSLDQYRIKRLKERFPSLKFVDVAPLIDRQRMIKTQEEIEILRRNGRISALSVLEAMKKSKPGVFEYQLEAEALYMSQKNGAVGPAYSPIVGSGPNACVLHYTRNTRDLRDGDLVLMDYGAVLDNLCMDITRTWPANGTFSEEQKKVYRTVLEVQKACIEAYKPGVTRKDVQEHVAKVMKKKGLDPRGLKGGIGHYVGLATHDVGVYGIPLQEGMVFAIEPAIYDRETNICIRVEDTVLITKDGCEVLTSDVPKEIEEIEALMKGR